MPAAEMREQQIPLDRHHPLAAPPDAWITTKVKLSLLTAEGVSGTAVHVDTVIGQVTLHGKVGSAAEKQKVEQVAKQIETQAGNR
jgi:osmotically-inducible protein OsmY